MAEELNDRTLLARIDERTSHLLGQVEKIEEMIAREYVRQAEFTPVRNIVYGMVAVILLTVLTAIVMIVVKK